MKIFGIGVNKTGTKSLGHALKTLGFDNNHNFDFKLIEEAKADDLTRIQDIINKHDSFEDWPYPLIYKKLDELYPDAKFILTLRKDPDTWFHSLVKHSKLTGPTKHREAIYGFSMPAQENKKAHIKYYNKHNNGVVEYFKDRPDKLLILNFETMDHQELWTKLCAFLGIEEVPEKRFPHMVYGKLRNRKKN